MLDNDILKESCRFCETFFGCHQAVLVFDGEYIIIADHAEIGDEILPVLSIVTVSDSAEDP